MKESAVLLVMSGPSGVGKSTIFKGVAEQVKKLHFSISCTTRAPREGEEHGIHYYFITKDDFQKHIANEDFLEYAEVHGNYYGTLKSEVANNLAKGLNVILDIDVQGQRLVRKALENSDLSKKASYVFIAPPSYQILRDRLYGRGTDAVEVVEKRLKNAVAELSAWQEYDFLVVNDQLEVAVQKITSILIAQSCQTKINDEISFVE